MQPSEEMAGGPGPHDGAGAPADAMDLFEHMLEAEIMGNGTYGADPDLDLIEERLSQLRQGPEVADEPVADIAPVSAIAPQPLADLPSAPAPPPAAARPSAPPVIVAENRPAAVPRAATSADAVVLEAARAAGVAPAYRQPAKRQVAPPASRRRKRASRVPSFYFAVLALLVISFALFAVWRPSTDETIEMPGASAGTTIEVVPAVPSLPVRPVEAEASLDPQTTASVSSLPTAESPQFVAATAREGYTARRIVKLYRVDAQGNIIGLAPTP